MKQRSVEHILTYGPYHESVYLDLRAFICRRHYSTNKIAKFPRILQNAPGHGSIGAKSALSFTTCPSPTHITLQVSLALLQGLLHEEHSSSQGGGA